MPEHRPHLVVIRGLDTTKKKKSIWVRLGRIISYLPSFHQGLLGFMLGLGACSLTILFQHYDNGPLWIIMPTCLAGAATGLLAGKHLRVAVTAAISYGAILLFQRSHLAELSLLSIKECLVIIIIFTLTAILVKLLTKTLNPRSG